MKSLSKRNGMALMIGGGALLGTVGVPLHEANQHPLTAVWFRCLFGCIALSIVLAISGRLADLKLKGRHLFVVMVSSLLMLLSWWLFFEAILRTSIALATLVFHLQPFIVMGFGAWLFGERFKLMQWVAVGVAITGLALVSNAVSALLGIKRIDLDEWVGLIMCLLGAFCYALVVVLTKYVQIQQTISLTDNEVPASTPPDPIVLVWWQCAIGVLILGWWPVLHGLPCAPEIWAWLLILGVFNTGLAYTLLYAGIAKLPSGRIALLQFAYPLTAVVVDGMVYGRVLDILQTFGLVLIVAAVLATVRSTD